MADEKRRNKSRTQRQSSLGDEPDAIETYCFTAWDPGRRGCYCPHRNVSDWPIATNRGAAKFWSLMEAQRTSGGTRPGSLGSE
jgi:hypothetical protein